MLLARDETLQFPRLGILIDLDYAEDLNLIRKAKAEEIAKQKSLNATKDSLNLFYNKREMFRAKVGDDKKPKSRKRKGRPSEVCRIMLDEQEKEEFEEMLRLHGHRTVCTSWFL